MVTSAFNPPLVVPSFSSRGFPQDRKNLRKVTRQHFRSFADSFSSFLVSAFDLHFGYIRPSDIPKNSVVFVDSGGYESREWEDDSATHLKLLPHVHEKWTQALLARTIRSLPDEPRFVYVNYDLEAGLSAQVSSATAQLRHLRSAKRSFLLKEEPVLVKKERVRGQMVPIVRTLSKLPQVADSLSKFEIFGITEKSLGYSYHDRIANLHLLCCLLKKLNLNLPVHVFGALDPLSVRTYAMAGADIFDQLVVVDWFEECKAMHSGACGLSQQVHHTRKIIDAGKRGVKVEAIIDAKQIHEKKVKIGLVAKGGVTVYLDGAHAIAHNKVMVIDGKIVITGSFNFTKGAESENAENILVIRSAELAAKYMANYKAHLAQSAKFNKKE